MSEAEHVAVRYRVGTQRLAARCRLDVDPTSGDEPDDSARLASDLLHSLHSPDDVGWTDDEGYGWWGDEPDGGWPTVRSEKRATTLR